MAASLVAKRKRQAARLRKHCDDFMRDGEFKMAADILEVAEGLDPSFALLVRPAHPYRK
eukprot:SAG22_NODE_11811_length_468_cov_0.970190_1_plen_59_part_00